MFHESLTIGYTNYYKPHATYMAQGKKNAQLLI